MKVYTGTFVKKDGSFREMTFAKVSDLPKDLLPEKKGGKPAKLKEGMELVWDLKTHAFRIFNYNTVVGKLKESFDPNYINDVRKTLTNKGSL